MRNAIVRTAMAGLIALALAGFAGIAGAQQLPANPGSESQHDHGQAPDAKASPQMMPMSTMPMMMQQHDQMMDGMRAADARLHELTVKMQAVRGPAKVNAMAELLAAIVAEHAQMLQLHESMMKQMMTNMPGMMDKMDKMDKMNPTPKP